MMTENHEVEGASVKEQLVEACRRNNVDLFQEIISGRSDDEISKLLNNTTTIMGNHLLHEAALQGNYDIIDAMLDHGIECDPLTRLDADTPLHSAVRWINSEPPEQRDFGDALVEMMCDAGCSTKIKNKARLTALELVDPRNAGLRDLIKRKREEEEEREQEEAEGLAEKDYEKLNASDFISQQELEEDDDDAEYSGSDEEERTEFYRRKQMRKGR